MSEAKTEETDGQEPTMEEILASIRRIISDEEEAGDDAQAEAAEAAPEPEPAPEPEAAAEEPLELGGDDEAGGDILELSEAEIEEIDEPDIEPEPDAGLDAEDVATPEPVAVEDYELADEPVAAAEPEPEPEPAFEPEPEPEPAPQTANLPSTARDLSGLLSEEAASAATGAFAGLAGVVTQTRGVPMGNSHKTLEDVVKELLRPMLKEWLDDNLPTLVERLVEKEIVKLVGRADQN